MATHTFMELALDEAHAAADAGEVPIGCVIVCDGDLIAQAANRTLADRDPTAHAEIIAIRQAAAALGRASSRAAATAATHEMTRLDIGGFSLRWGEGERLPSITQSTAGGAKRQA